MKHFLVEGKSDKTNTCLSFITITFGPIIFKLNCNFLLKLHHTLMNHSLKNHLIAMIKL